MNRIDELKQNAINRVTKKVYIMEHGTYNLYAPMTKEEIEEYKTLCINACMEAKNRFKA